MSGRPAAIVLTLLLVAAVIARLPLVALLAASLLAAVGAARVWRDFALQRLDYTRQLSSDRAFVGDTLDLTLTIVNRKPLPLSRLRVQDVIPAGLTAGGVGLSAGVRGETLLQRATALAWYEAVDWRYQLTAVKRGAYRFGPLNLESGDPFGLLTIREQRESAYDLLVYPRRLDLPDLLLPARNPLGDLSGGILQDPLRIVGVRDYGPTDPIKDIHWPATARTGRLQTRVYEPTAQRVLLLALDLDSFAFYYEGIDPELVEHSISAAAGLAFQAINAGFAVGLAVNGAAVAAEQLARIPPGRGDTQLAQLMRTLAALQPTSILPMARLLPRLALDLTGGIQLILISPVDSPVNRQALSSLARQGCSVSWLFTGSEPPAHLDAVTIQVAAYIPPGGTSENRRRRA